MKTETIGTARFDTAAQLVEAIQKLVSCVPKPHTAEEVLFSGTVSGTLFLEEETLTDGSKVYNLRIA